MKKEEGGDVLVKRRYSIIITSTIASVLVGSFLYYNLVSAQDPGDYDPWYDVNDDGKIDMRDIGGMARKFGAEGTPINKTELLLDLQAKVDVLNATVTSLKECIVITGSKPYNASIPYTSGTGFVINVSDSIPSVFTLVSVLVTGRKTNLGGTTLDEPPLNTLPIVNGINIEIRVWDAGGTEYDNWSNQRAHIDYTLFITK
ncbi:MAG: hypothetical protein PVF96_06705 [Candidatus Bathyarchaeota archaeon]|jgi:hypothetical protein